MQTARWILTGLAWAVSTAVLAPVCFFGVIFLAGPHSSVLPGFLQPVALLFAAAVFVVGPILIARQVWRRLPTRPST